MACKICGSAVRELFKRTIMNKYDVQYFQCTTCDFIQTETPFWLDEAYKNSLNIEDTGIIKRNLLMAKRTSVIISFLFDRKSQYLDYGGGTGLFVRLMRDYGYDFYWNDPYTENIFSRGFEGDISSTQQYRAVTTFECFEHFIDPRTEINKMLSLAPAIIFSTEIFTGNAPLPENWPYYYFSHGQHISLYSLKSLRILADVYNLQLLTNNKSFHVLTPRKHSGLFYQTLLKISATGISSLLTALNGSKTKFDAQNLSSHHMEHLS